MSCGPHPSPFRVPSSARRSSRARPAIGVLVAALALAVTPPLRAAPTPSPTPAAAPGPAAAVVRPARRFALVVGANDGGPGRVRLKYAHRDARAVADVLLRFGGVHRGDLLFQVNPDRPTLLTALQKVRGWLQAARQGGERAELVFYYSGHSDETGILLRGQHFTYREIRAGVGDLPADLRIAVLDSCASGVLTRLKGGVRRPPFLAAPGVEVRGKVFLTSASASEGAQESERLRGSIFTHFLLSGLRGAADADRDGKVTLHEAYRYAYQETLRRTESSRAGPMHASYDIQLQGAGDLVITDLRRATARLVLGAELTGRVFVRDARGQLVAEVAKAAGKPVTLGLEGGRYAALVQAGAVSFKGSVLVAAGSRVVLTWPQLRVASAAEAAVMKGSDPVPEPEPEPGAAPPAEAAPPPPAATLRVRAPHTLRPVAVGILPGMSTNAGSDGGVVNLLAFSLLCDRGDHLRGFELSLGCAIRTGDVAGLQFGLLANHAAGRVWGMQLTTGWNGALGGLIGLQLGGVNHVSGRVLGAQVGFVANSARGALYGLQVSGGVNIAWDGIGAQVGAVNVSLGRFAGLQVSAVNFAAGPFDGLQASAVNVAAGRLRGAQVSAVNVAGTLRGAQVGAVNVAGRAKGLQIGAFNYVGTDEGVAPIGVLNIAGNGIFAPTFWASGTSYLNVGLKVGTRHLYSLVGVGGSPGPSVAELQASGKDPSGARRLSAIAGLGGHIETGVRWLYVDIDLLVHRLVRDADAWQDSDWNTQLRVMVGFRLYRALSLYVGPTLDVMVSSVEPKISGAALEVFTRTRDAASTAPLYVQGNLGFVVGLAFEPHWGRLNENRR